MAKIRHATVADFQAMLAMGEAMHNESPRYRVHTFDPGKSKALLERMVSQPNNCLLLVAEADGHLAGMLLGLVSPAPFCNALTASELVVYVTPEARGGTVATKLIRSFEVWAFEKNANEIVLGVSTEVHADRTSAFYQRMGYSQSGHLLVKRCT